MKDHVKIVCISDTHTLHRQLTVPDGDILLHAGDITNMGELEAVEDFNDFLGTLPHRHKIVIAGNHDFCFERHAEEARPLLTNCIYLEDEKVTIDGISFYGSPWQPWFCNWAFNLHRGFQLRRKWELIPEGTDILITHGPPFGHGDKTCSGEAVGCMDLLRTIQKIRPRYHIFGHIHEAPGISADEHTTFVNASSCDFSYKIVNAPVVLEW